MASLAEGVAFWNSSYGLSLPENQPAGAMVGRVWASSGSPLYRVTYALKTHADVFSVNASGAILTRVELDREQQAWFILDVEAVDTRSPPTTAAAVVRSHLLHMASPRRSEPFPVLQVTVEVEDVNEPPRFPHSLYQASVLSVAPYRAPVITVRVWKEAFPFRSLDVRGSSSDVWGGFFWVSGN